VDDQPIAVMLDFVHPIRAGRLAGEGGNAGFHETCWGFPARGHIGAIAACSDQPQPSSCCVAENVVLLERAKKNKIAALNTLMISRGMFSRDHISTPSQLVSTDYACTSRAGMHHCCRSRSIIV
jgi:hypothetical protein